MRAQMDHIVLNVRDVEGTLRFYTEVIGLGSERVDEYHEGSVLFPSLRLNEDTIIDVLPPELWGGGEEPAGRPNVDHFCLTVDAADWQALNDRLQAAGVELELEPTTLWGAHGDGTAIYIRDAEGNRVELRYYAG